ncbi:MAG: FecR domain-containing protein [Candidatus Riflebacteria bacterium]|nr:FecR domain-containing protein [Candidatus Riflebacteria bacterium]
MDCTRIRDLVELEVGGKLDASGTRDVTDHVAACGACREYREAALVAARALAAVPLEPFPERRSRQIMALVRGLPSPDRRSFWARLVASFTPARAWGLAAVPAMAAVVLLLWPRGIGPNGDPEQRPPARPMTVAVRPPTRPAPAPAQVPAVAPVAPLGTIAALAGEVSVAGRRVPGAAKVPFSNGDEVVLHGAAGKATLAWADGTRVSLERAARARLGPRRLQLLSGSALAAVSRTGSGFELELCSFQVRVMGTRFAADCSHCEVQLLEGRVKASHGLQEVVLSPSQAAMLDGTNLRRRTLSEAERRELTTRFAGFEGAASLSAALGVSVQALNGFLNGAALPPAELLSPPGAAQSRPPEGPKTGTAASGQEQPAPFNPLHGLGR